MEILSGGFFWRNFLGGILFCIGIDFGFCQDFVSRQKEERKEGGRKEGRKEGRKKDGRRISIFRSASASSSHLKIQ